MHASALSGLCRAASAHAAAPRSVPRGCLSPSPAVGPPRRGAAGGAGRVLPWCAPRPFQEALSAEDGGGWFPAAGSRLGAAAGRYARHGLSFSSSGLSSVPSSVGHRGCFSGARCLEARSYLWSDGRWLSPAAMAGPEARPAPRSVRPRVPPCPHCGRWDSHGDVCGVTQWHAGPVRVGAFFLAIRRAERRVGTCVGLLHVWDLFGLRHSGGCVVSALRCGFLSGRYAPCWGCCCCSASSS